MTPRYQSSYPDGTTTAEVYADAIERAFLATFGKKLTADAFGGEWEKNERSRAPYTDAWKMGHGGFTLFASPTLNHCCVEISGQGCEALISSGLLNSVMSSVEDRVTRIDIACDVECDTRPAEFVQRMKHGRMRSSGYQNSDTGETCYVGSQKSDRYARVYRYNKPHPRSHLLRIEHVFRRENAKLVAKQCVEHGVDGVSLAAGEAFGWEHEVWGEDNDSDIDISVVREQGNEGRTVFWLVNSAAPAFKRLCASGGIKNPQEFLERYFTPE